jgi:hypothetical protein
MLTARNTEVLPELFHGRSSLAKPHATESLVEAVAAARE